MHVFHLSTGSDFSELNQIGKQAKVMAIGHFDGVHTGHQEVLVRAVNTARLLNAVPAVMTFHPHPREVFGHSKYKELLTPLEDKLERFADLGLEQVCLVRFDDEFARLSPDSFVEKILFPQSIKSLVVGFDFRFGHQGAGNVDTLGMLAAGEFAVEVVHPYHMNNEKVSSTLIRECLLDAHVSRANRLLGRPYAITGQVVRGEGRGRTIGVPTANIQCSRPYVIPGRGVYAVRMKVGNQWLNGVMNIGWKPTFSDDSGEDTLEVHLLEFNDSIYGEDIVLQFIDFIRHERKFDSAEQLVEQIQQDIAAAKQLLSQQE